MLNSSKLVFKSARSAQSNITTVRRKNGVIPDKSGNKKSRLALEAMPRDPCVWWI